jgi:hypothetical protein
MFKGRTYLAIGLLVVVGGVTAWKLTRTSPYEHKNDKAASPLPPLKKDDIDELEITDAGKPPVVLKKDGAEWKVTAPVADRADQKAVEQAVDALAGLSLRDVIAEKQESWDKVGLKESDTTKVVPKKAGTALATIQVGKTGNVRLGDSPEVWSTSGLRRFALVKDVKMWRDRSILSFAQDKLDTIEVAYADGVKVAVKREQPTAPPAAPDAGPPPPPPPAKWVLVDGKDKIGGALDETLALNLSASLARLEASDFPTDAAKAGLDKPRMTVTVTLTDKTQKQLLVGADDGQDTYVKLVGGDRVWKTHKYDADRIPSSPANWRDKTLVRIPRADVAKLELAKGTDKVLLERVDDKSFRGVVPADLGPIDQTRVTAVLATLEVLRANRVIDQPDPKTFATPVVTVTVTKKDGKTFKLLVGKKDAKLPEYPVQVAGEKDVYGVAEYVIANYLKSPSEFKKKPGS